MQVSELLEQLQNVDPTIEVRIAFQPSYPLAATVAAVTEVGGDIEDIDLAIVQVAEDDFRLGDEPTRWESEADAQDELDRRADAEADAGGHFLWIAASDGVGWSDNPYAPRAAWDRY